MDTALQTISSEQAKFGSRFNRLNYGISNQSRASVMTEQALGRIMDSDFARESTALQEAKSEPGSDINAGTSKPVYTVTPVDPIN